MKMKLTDYLVQRLYKLGIEEIFGLPGDFNFNIVEAIEKNNNVNWIGSTNELNAGYGADGYARIKGYGAIVTTFGVGELSAINAIAGCMAENVPVMKIVGTPSTKHIENRTLLHHNLASADYYAFKKAFDNVVEASAFLTKENPKQEIDRLFSIMIKTKKPVYLAIPMDICDVEVDCDFEIEEQTSDKELLSRAANEIVNLIQNSKKPALIADILTTRFGAKENLNAFLKKTKIPSTSFIRGMDIVDSDTKNYFGVYCGKIANKSCYDYVNSSDLVILSGGVVSDLNTMNFDFNFELKNTIDIQPDYVKIKNVKYENVLMNDLIKLVTEKINYSSTENFEFGLNYEKTQIKETKPLDCEYIYSRLYEFIKEDDIFVTEVGLTPFGAIPMKLPKNVSVQNQILWGSIGWATPCAFGCAIADRSRRTILITGDGAHQLTAQEIATMMRNKVKPIIFVINNSGYTVERILCDDVDYLYNDISQWNYAKLPEVFSGDCFSATVKTNSEFDEVLKKIEKVDRMCYIELKTGYLDIPPLAKAIAKHPEKL